MDKIFYNKVNFFIPSPTLLRAEISFNPIQVNSVHFSDFSVILNSITFKLNRFLRFFSWFLLPGDESKTQKGSFSCQHRTVGNTAIYTSTWMCRPWSVTGFLFLKQLRPPGLQHWRALAHMATRQPVALSVPTASCSTGDTCSQLQPSSPILLSAAPITSMQPGSLTPSLRWILLNTQVPRKLSDVLPH